MAKFRFMQAQHVVCSRKSITTSLVVGLIAGSFIVSFWTFRIYPYNISSKLAEYYENKLTENFPDYKATGNIQRKANSSDRTTLINVIKNARKDDHFINDERKTKSTTGAGRILCAVMSNPLTLSQKSVAVNNTWGRRCDILLFICEVTYPDLPILLVKTTSGREFLSHKHRIAFDLIYKDYLQDADWFFKADDDTFVFMENLRQYLSDKDPAEPSYYGHHYIPGPPSGFITGGSGYVMSREALKRLGERKEDVYSHNATSADDLLLGYAMEKLGVKQVNGLDSHGRHLFHFHTIYQHITGNYLYFYKDFEGRPVVHGIENMTDIPISFHYVTPQEMYVIEYTHYRVLPAQRFSSNAAFMHNKEDVIVLFAYIFCKVFAYMTIWR